MVVDMPCCMYKKIIGGNKTLINTLNHCAKLVLHHLSDILEWSDRLKDNRSYLIRLLYNK
jgi:hypothetical protein